MKKLFSFYVDPEQLSRLKEHCEKKGGVPVAALIRNLIEDFIFFIDDNTPPHESDGVNRNQKYLIDVPGFEVWESPKPADKPYSDEEWNKFLPNAKPAENE